MNLCVTCIKHQMGVAELMSQGMNLFEKGKWNSTNSPQHSLQLHLARVNYQAKIRMASDKPTIHDITGPPEASKGWVKAGSSIQIVWATLPPVPKIQSMFRASHMWLSEKCKSAASKYVLVWLQCCTMLQLHI